MVDMLVVDRYWHGLHSVRPSVRMSVPEWAHSSKPADVSSAGIS